MPRWSARTAGIFAAVVALAVGLYALLAQPDAGRVVAAFWRGSLGTGSAFFSGTLVRAIPLMIVGVGIAIAFRAGVFNIGGEGQLLLGAIVATGIGLTWAPAFGVATIVVALLASAVAGAAWAAIAAVLRTRFGVLEVISTIMLNFVAANLVSYLVRGPLQERSHIYPQTELIDVAARLPRVWPETRLHAGLAIAVGVAVGVWWFLSHTAAGFRVRAVGASPTASRVTGRIEVERVTAGALVASGALAGLAGGIEVAGVTYALYENLSPGFGFSAIAVAILARLNPLAVVGTSLLFATLETGALGMQRDAGVPSVVASALEAVAILLVVALGGRFVKTSWWPVRRRVSPESLVA
jgi:simple sugar transport system permease protein